MAKRKPRTSEQTVSRMKAAIDRVRIQTETDDDLDISLKPPAWWRERWHDKHYQRLFLENFIKIRSDEDDNQLVPFRFNDVQSDYHENCTGNDVILKSRQQGFTTYILAKSFARALLFSGTNWRTVPHDPEAEDEFWLRLDTMYQNLPTHLRPEARYYSKEEMLFQDGVKGVRDSRVTSLSPTPGKEGKGRGLTLTHLHLSEVPFWLGDQRKTLNSLLTAAQHGKVTVESTAQGMEWFYQTYEQGKRPNGRFKSHFYQWWWTRKYRLLGARFEKTGTADGSSAKTWVLVMPHEKLRRDAGGPPAVPVSPEEFVVAAKVLRHLRAKGYVNSQARWFCDEVAEYIAWRRQKIKDLPEGEIGFKVEYPESDIDCFENTGRSVISPRYLKATCEPQAEPQINHRYVIGCDTSLGLPNSDPAAIEVLDVDTGRQVHSESLLMSPDLLAFKLVELSDRYNWATIAVERNNTGIATLKKLNELVEDTRIYKELTQAAWRAIEDGRKTYDEAMAEAEFGIVTTTANKGVMAVYLEEAVRNCYIGLSSEDWCTEARTVVWVGSNQWEALTGFHDDRFMAMAIANYVRVQVMSQTTGFVGVMPQTGYAR